MKKITHYNSILAAMEFKNIYQNVEKFLKENETIKNFGFGTMFTELNSSYGTKMLRLKKEEPRAQIQINQIRIQYEDDNVPIEKTSQILEIMNQLKEARKKITDNEEINFQGVILKALYELEENELEKIKKKLFNYGNEFKQGELKLSFLDDDKLNYNIVFILKNKKLVVSFDVNSRFLNDKWDWNIEKIVNKIKEYTENENKLKKILGI